MSFSDRQYFVQELVAVRNLAITCAKGEHEDGSELGMRCDTLVGAVDSVMAELIGDHAYPHLEAWPGKRA